MHFFIIGASGYIGGVIAAKLQSQGHSVSGLARSQAAEERLKQAGVEVIKGHIQDISGLTQHVLSADAVIYTAVEFSPEGFEAEYQAIKALIAILKGTNKSLIFTSGLGVLGNSNFPMNEDSPYNPWPLVTRRIDTEKLLQTAAELKHIKATIIRPGMVYGGEKGNGLDLYVKGAIKLEQAPYLDKGENRWPVIHINDLANLYLLLATNLSENPSLVHALTDEVVTFKQIAQAVAEHFQLSKGSVSWSSAQLSEIWGPEAEIFGVNQHIKRSRAIDSLGWGLNHQGILEEVKSLGANSD